jgi:hypothetical protein
VVLSSVVGAVGCDSWPHRRCGVGARRQGPDGVSCSVSRVLSVIVEDLVVISISSQVLLVICTPLMF